MSLTFGMWRESAERRKWCEVTKNGVLVGVLREGEDNMWCLTTMADGVRRRHYVRATSGVDAKKHFSTVYSRGELEL